MTSINSNIASTMANSLSSLRLNTAQKAFQTAQRPPAEVEQEILQQFQEDKGLIDNKKTLMAKLSSNEIDEMKEISSTMGEVLSDEDIQYALKYGRSVIADYSV